MCIIFSVNQKYRQNVSYLKHVFMTANCVTFEIITGNIWKNADARVLHQAYNKNREAKVYVSDTSAALHHYMKQMKTNTKHIRRLLKNPSFH